LAQLIPLKQLAVAGALAKINALQSQANAFAAIGAPGLPGIPNVKKLVKKMLESQALKYLEEARNEIIPLLVGIMSGVMIAMIPKINAIIRKLNSIITAINAAISLLIPIAQVIFAVIIALVIVKVVTMILGMIPSPGAGMGAVVVFDMAKTICADINAACIAMLADLTPIAFQIVATLLMILKIYGLFMMIMGIINAFMALQNKAGNDAHSVSNMTANDFANSTTGDGSGDGQAGKGSGIGGGAGIDDGNYGLVECTLPDGTKAQMTPEDCLAAGGTFGEMELLNELNDLNNQINDLNAMLGACTLPDGSVKQMTPEDCAAAGGTFGAIDPNLCWSGCKHGVDLDGSKTITCQLPDGSNKDITLDECNNQNGIDLSVANVMGLLSELKSKRDTIKEELGSLSNFTYGEMLITSLIHPHNDATIENATENTGKRKGFYQSDIK